MKSLFDFIAPVYKLFYNYQKKHYNQVVSHIQNEIIFSSNKRIIDVGCGTGALCSVLNQKGFSVTGIDPSQKMIDVAIRKTENKDINFINANVLKKLPFENKSFDISIASYVAHGLSKDERQVMYSEMNRLSRDYVIIYDYNESRALLTDVVEYLENGDYFNFIKSVKFELKDFFKYVKIINVSKRGSWYICNTFDDEKIII